MASVMRCPPDPVDPVARLHPVIEAPGAVDVVVLQIEQRHLGCPSGNPWRSRYASMS